MDGDSGEDGDGARNRGGNYGSGGGGGASGTGSRAADRAARRAARRASRTAGEPETKADERKKNSAASIGAAAGAACGMLGAAAAAAAADDYDEAGRRRGGGGGSVVEPIMPADAPVMATATVSAVNPILPEDAPKVAVDGASARRRGSMMALAAQALPADPASQTPEAVKEKIGAGKKGMLSAMKPDVRAKGGDDGEDGGWDDATRAVRADLLAALRMIDTLLDPATPTSGPPLDAKARSRLAVQSVEANWYLGIIFARDPSRATKAVSFLAEAAHRLDADGKLADDFKKRAVGTPDNAKKKGVMSFNVFQRFVRSATARNRRDGGGECVEAADLLDRLTVLAGGELKKDKDKDKDKDAEGDDGAAAAKAAKKAKAKKALLAKLKADAAADTAAQEASAAVAAAAAATEVKGETKSSSKQRKKSLLKLRKSQKALDYEAEDDEHTDYDDELSMHDTKHESIDPAAQLAELDTHLKEGKKRFKDAMEKTDKGDKDAAAK
eukprot:g4594.t1